MSFAKTSIKGIVFSDSRRILRGLTLFTPVDDNSVYLIDLKGNIVKKWKFNFKSGCYGELLPNGNLLYAGKITDGTFSDIEGAGGVLIEVNWDGKVIWEYKDTSMHHSFYRRRNGNTLILKWTELPKKIADRIEGGDTGSELNGIMLGEIIQEITPNGKVVWEWIAHENECLIKTTRCPICPRETWLHANSISELENENILVSFPKINMIAIIDKKTKDLIWKWGNQGELAHQHSPISLKSGNILVYDNGFHPNKMAQNYSRVLEIDPESDKIIWAYEGQTKEL